jgi:hypothetical protein
MISSSFTYHEHYYHRGTTIITDNKETKRDPTNLNLTLIKLQEKGQLKSDLICPLTLDIIVRFDTGTESISENISESISGISWPDSWARRRWAEPLIIKSDIMVRLEFADRHMTLKMVELAEGWAKAPPVSEPRS